MTAIREFALQDLFKFNRIVFDQLTEVYSLEFFLNKFLEYPFLSEVATAPNGQIMGFLIGCRIIDSDNRVGDTKHFDFNNNHGHVSVLTIDHKYRCLGLGTILMNLFKAKLDLKNDLFVDLYVRRRNVRAVRLYISLGFVIWRELPRYYRDDIGYEMRLPLTRDVSRKCLKQPKSKLDILYSIGHQLLEMPMNYLVRLMNALCSLMMK
ncbi:N-alpha-acetyltransferase 20 [Drosophila sulfurigaster albostrigata]|uniref:N-alpha-acetyltransferase 20 n=1 Tax=Drosophila sulfurigaster albostrigata TaxID=89887 RepID=UPI002D21EE39|nr:N-alpha-acetyltransferase 20 [Drosophila sulfurigaster albostrigata]